jgi:16S rRNA (uracil1498-N3)-methyltransferase
MHRFFVNKENIKKDIILVTGDDVKHIKNVLRLKSGDTIELCDGESNDYIVSITEISKNYVKCNIVEKYKSKSEPPIEVLLYQGLPKSAKMDLIVQKVVELGVTEIVPVITERTVVKINEDSKEKKKLERWQKISLEAAKQSKRGMIPRIHNIISFDEMIEILKTENNILVPYENETKLSIKEALKEYKNGKVNIVIGPEGGFEESEIIKLKDINANIITLGPRILRTETAGFTTVGIVMYELGDLGVV